ncbi:MAG: hypothetical protein PVF73_11185, partial [Bacteroidales bacterium]
TCCSFVAELCKKNNLNFVYQKLTGGPRIRDLVRICAPDVKFNSINDSINLKRLDYGVDFNDIGYASSHSVDNYKEYSNKSYDILNRLLGEIDGNLTICEVAGNLNQDPNIEIIKNLLRFHDKYVFISSIKWGVESINSIYYSLKKLKVCNNRIYFTKISSSNNNSSLYKDFTENRLNCKWLSQDFNEFYTYDKNNKLRFYLSNQTKK